MGIEALQKAIEVCGGVTGLANAIGVKQPRVSNWVARERVPAEMCRAIEAATGVTCAELRPDIFPPHPLAGSLPPDDRMAERRTGERRQEHATVPESADRREGERREGPRRFEDKGAA